ncbi:PilZ domain-containing protein [Gilvimarinus agarilyticus]|uniref:PilZ domain-containing protein n=1 Tax=unclassified Gilvimarinus TaxID=2642066 RepID=UPI001C08B40E|nr:MULTISPECIES: PilZ domain-containing protein [unclassified Gilvimarinus]MBU2885352.1 PilZ domain-containing protein [Gilvimarinus agarilyticus]MDO6570251.1 PilZ domain-containing protein [Gilvimarinus sp. 2_MG-2023]MDO6748248.1 PilZ domain-containing protein [Gilvimarinus sp. 1_MG-2023]
MVSLIDHEGRKIERQGVSQSIDVYDNIHDVYLGRVVNIHSDGLMMMGDQPFQEDCLYRLDLHLSAPVNGRNSVQLGVDCLWVRNAEDNGKHWAGFSIIDASPQAMEDITSLAELH